MKILTKVHLRMPIDMDGTVHTDFPKFETNRDINTIISPFVYL